MHKCVNCVEYDSQGFGNDIFDVLGDLGISFSIDNDIDINIQWYIDVDDLWIFDKSILSRKLGFKCGPAGIPVPKPGNYVVRPCVNLEGMGKGASIKHIKDSSWDIVPAGYFWQELFTGRHISVDFEYQKQIRATEGFRTSKNLMMFNYRYIIV